MKSKTLEEIDRIIEMAWEDRTPFEAIEATYNSVSYTHLRAHETS